ncbi:MAG: calcium/sodium antiporter [Oscillospiraceae bacterium]|nr:calcium/sodium antiporter [Oscillospiraceae bacterium]
MEILIVILFFIIGLILIIKGGDYFVDAASWIAEVSGIPKFIIGATIVSLATTLPEFLVSLFATFDGKTDIAVGNAVGSITANTGLIMAISIIVIPAVIKRKTFAPKAIMLLVALASLLVISYGGELKIGGVIIMLVIFIAFMIENIRFAKNNTSEKKIKIKDKKEVAINIVKFIGGTAGIVLGADLLVDYGSALARIIHMPESIIGVTLIAIGTSLPEFVTTLTAISKKQSSLSIGNIVGANIIDATMILPICAFANGGSLPVDSQTILFDLPTSLGVAAIAILPTLFMSKFSRWQGAFMIFVYIAYVVVLVI